MSLSTSTDTERELNGGNEQKDWSRSNRVSSAHMVQEHFKLFGGYWRVGEVHWKWEKMQTAHPVFHYMLRLLSLARHANCGQAHQEEPVLVLHSSSLTF